MFKIKHLDFCPKIIVISKNKKRSSLQTSLRFSTFCPNILVISKKKILTSNQSRISLFLTLKTSDIGEKTRKKEFLHRVCLRSLAEFLKKWAGQNPKKLGLSRQNWNVWKAYVILENIARATQNLYAGHSKSLRGPNVKNIRNNLLNLKKFVFPEFSFSCLQQTIVSKGGYISWDDMKNIYDKDSKLTANLRKACKLSLSAIFPYKNKQNVRLALAIFHETTISAAKCYIPKRQDCSFFLTLINTWWSIVNAKTQFCANPLAHAIVPGDNKIEFLKAFANWLKVWCQSRSAFCLSKQTFDAMVTTLKSQAALIVDLLGESYRYVISAKFQSDLLGKRFSQYRQMSGGNFLVSMKEIQDTKNSNLQIVFERGH